MGAKASTLSKSNCSSYCPAEANGGRKASEKNVCDSDAAEEKQPVPESAIELFMFGYGRAKSGPCLGTRKEADSEYTWRTYEQTLADALAVGTYLTQKLGLKKGDFVGTMCNNCAKLATLELACYAYGLVIVPLYDTLGTEACSHILDEAGLGVVLCRAAPQAAKVRALAEGLPLQRSQPTLIVADAAVDGEGEGEGRLLTFDGILAEGAELRKQQQQGEQELPAELPAGSDLAVICYTSGTTGRPKGVMLTNANMANGITLVARTIQEDTFRQPIVLNSSDVYFSYLPVAHILERMCQLMCLRYGVSIGFFRGDRARMLDDMRQCRPTFMAAVPKVISKIYDVAMAAAAASRMKQLLLERALKKKMALVQELRLTRSTLWDWLVLRKVQAALGGRLRFMALGGAPISPDTLRFAKAAFGCAVTQGFGQTETSGLGFAQRPGDPSVDTIGQPMLGVEAKLVDAPELGYFADSAQGEICIRGPCCFKGYYKQKDKTDEVLDAEGWVHTGDIGVRLADGSYRVVDRAKNLFKLSQGEYVSPEKIELVYALLPTVDQVFVDGSSEKSWLLGVVVPSRDAALRWAAEQPGRAAADDDAFADACASVQFKQLILTQMQQLGRENGLQGFEQVKDIVLTTEAFTAENDLLTPTMKMKRPQLRRKFADTFAAMYSELEK